MKVIMTLNKLPKIIASSHYLLKNYNKINFINNVQLDVSHYKQKQYGEDFALRYKVFAGSR